MVTRHVRQSTRPRRPAPPHRLTAASAAVTFGPLDVYVSVRGAWCASRR
jgi:hypothetical protein